MGVFTALSYEVIESIVCLRVALERRAGVRQERGEVFNEPFVARDGGLHVAEELTQARAMMFSRISFGIEGLVDLNHSTFVRARLDPSRRGESRARGDAVEAFHRSSHRRCDDDDRVHRYVRRRFAQYRASVRFDDILRRGANFAEAGQEEMKRREHLRRRALVWLVFLPSRGLRTLGHRRFGHRRFGRRCF